MLNDPFNTATIKQISGFDRPQVMVISFSYTTPKINNFGGNNVGGKAIRFLARDWTLSGVLRYQSGGLIASATSNNNLWQKFGCIERCDQLRRHQPAGKLCGRPVLPGCESEQQQFRPDYDGCAESESLWSNQTTPTFGDSAPYYTNCRWRRQPAESLSLGRIFRVKEKYQLLIQAQFFNVFNRVTLPSRPSERPPRLRPSTTLYRVIRRQPVLQVRPVMYLGRSQAASARSVF